MNVYKDALIGFHYTRRTSDVLRLLCYPPPTSMPSWEASCRVGTNAILPRTRCIGMCDVPWTHSGGRESRDSSSNISRLLNVEPTGVQLKVSFDLLRYESSVCACYPCPVARACAE